MESNPGKRPPVKIIAHRGDSSEAPENTLAAFKKAIALGVDYFECDVQLSKDGVPVVIHDRTFLRITAGMREHDVDQLTLAEIKELDAGLWFGEKFKGEKIPTLEELLLIPRGPVGIMIEVKDETIYECGLALLVGNVLKKTAHAQRGQGEILIGSLNPDLLLCFHAFLPEQKRIGIVENEERFERFKELAPSKMAFHYSMLYPERIQELQDKGFKVWSWTVDDKSTALELIHSGIDGLITNIPKKMQSIHLSSHFL